MTPTVDPVEDDHYDVAFRLRQLPVVRPYYRTLSEFERQVLDSRQADLEREQRMDYDPYAA